MNIELNILCYRCCTLHSANKHMNALLRPTTFHFMHSTNYVFIYSPMPFRLDSHFIFVLCSRQLVSLLNMISNSSATYIWSILFFFCSCCCWLFVLRHERGVRQLEHIWFICLQIFANTHVFVTFVETFRFQNSDCFPSVHLGPAPGTRLCNIKTNKLMHILFLTIRGHKFFIWWQFYASKSWFAFISSVQNSGMYGKHPRNRWSSGEYLSESDTLAIKSTFRQF